MFSEANVRGSVPSGRQYPSGYRQTLDGGPRSLREEKSHLQPVSALAFRFSVKRRPWLAVSICCTLKVRRLLSELLPLAAAANEAGDRAEPRIALSIAFWEKSTFVSRAPCPTVAATLGGTALARCGPR